MGHSVLCPIRGEANSRTVRGQPGLRWSFIMISVVSSTLFSEPMNTYFHRLDFVLNPCLSLPVNRQDSYLHVTCDFLTARGQSWRRTRRPVADQRADWQTSDSRVTSHLSEEQVNSVDKDKHKIVYAAIMENKQVRPQGHTMIFTLRVSHAGEPSIVFIRDCPCVCVSVCLRKSYLSEIVKLVLWCPYKWFDFDDVWPWPWPCELLSYFSGINSYDARMAARRYVLPLHTV